ncbi:hypothetical protein [Neobacillus sp. Marseille-QA0830]
MVYQATEEQYKKLDTSEEFKNGDQLGFLTIKQIEDNLNEVTVGVGGAKITTQVKTRSMSDEADTMMQIVHSVQY